MGSGVGFLSHALCGTFVTVVPGVVAVRPQIFFGFIAPDVVREAPAAESTGAVGAPCWLVASPVPVYAGITADLAALVFCLWGYSGAAVGVVVAAASTVALRSFPVAVAFGSSPSLVAGFGSTGC